MRRPLFAVAVFALAASVGIAADSGLGIKKGTDAFSGKIRGKSRVERAGGQSAIWIDQVDGAAIRVASDRLDEWSVLDGKWVVASGDFMVYGGQPVMLVRKAGARKQGVSAARANIDVQGKLLTDRNGNVLVDTRDGYIRVGNPDKLGNLSAGAKVRMRGTLVVDNGAMVLLAADAGEMKKGTAHIARGGKKRSGVIGAVAAGEQHETADAPKRSRKSAENKNTRKAKVENSWAKDQFNAHRSKRNAAASRTQDATSADFPAAASGAPAANPLR